VAGGANEGQPPQHVSLEAALAALATLGLYQPGPLVVTEGRGGEAAAPSDFADREHV
jgi:hypothetical protein